MIPIEVKNTRQKIVKLFFDKYNFNDLENFKNNLNFLNPNENEKKLFKLISFLINNYEIDFELKTLLDFYNQSQSEIVNIESFYRYVFNKALNLNFNGEYYINSFSDQYYVRKSNSDNIHYNAYAEVLKNSFGVVSADEEIESKEEKSSEEIKEQIESDQLNPNELLNSLDKILSDIFLNISNTFDKDFKPQKNSLIKILINEFYFSLKNNRQKLQKINNFINQKTLEKDDIISLKNVFYDLFKSSKHLIALRYMNENRFDFDLETFNYTSLSEEEKKILSDLINFLIISYKKIFITLIQNIENNNYKNIFDIEDLKKLYRTVDSLITHYHLFFNINIENLLENLLELFNNFQALKKIIKTLEIDQAGLNSINDIFNKNKNVNSSILNLYKLIKTEIDKIETQFKENFKNNIDVNEFPVFINYNLLNEKITILNELIISLKNYLPNIDFDVYNNIITDSNILFYYNNLKNDRHIYSEIFNENLNENINDYIELQDLNYYFNEININPNLLSYKNFYLSLDNLFSYDLKDFEDYQNLSKFFAQYLIKNKIYEIRKNILQAADHGIMLSSYDFAKFSNSLVMEKNSEVLKWIENTYPFFKKKIKNIFLKKENDNLNQFIRLQKINQNNSENSELIFNYKKQFNIQNLFKNYFKFGAFFEKENYLFFFQVPEILTMLKTIDLLNFDINLKIKISEKNSKLEIQNIEWEYNLEDIKENILNNLDNFGKRLRFNILLSKYENKIIDFYLNIYQELLYELKINIMKTKNEFEEILNVSEKDPESIILNFQNKILKTFENCILDFIEKKRNKFQFKLMRQIVLYKNEFLKKELNNLNKIDNPDVYDFYKKLNSSKKIIVVSFSHTNLNLYTFNPFYNNTYEDLKRLSTNNHQMNFHILNIFKKINKIPTNYSESKLKNILNNEMNNKFKLTFSQFYTTDDFETIKSHFQNYIEIVEDLSKSKNKVSVEKKKLLNYLFYQNIKWLDNHFSKYEKLNVNFGTNLLPLKAYYPNIIVLFDERLDQIEHIKAFQKILDFNLFYSMLNSNYNDEFNISNDGHVNDFKLNELYYSFLNDDYLFLDLDIESNSYKFKILFEDLKNLFYIKELKNTECTEIYFENLISNFWKSYLLSRENLLNFLEASKKLYFAQIALNLKNFKNFKEIQEFENNIILTNYKLFKEFFKSNKINMNFLVI